VALGVGLVGEAPAHVPAGIGLVAAREDGRELGAVTHDVVHLHPLGDQEPAFRPHLHVPIIGRRVADVSDGNPQPLPNDETITEPENSTVDDWMGQRVERDTERAEQIARETDDPAEAERRFDEVSEDERPGDLPTEQRRK
jgi:hypothetical protein